MPIKYPAQLDNTSNIPDIQDGTTLVSGSLINLIKQAVVAVEAELGIKPSATYTTVKARLDGIDDQIAVLSGAPGTGASDGLYNCASGISVGDAVYIDSSDNIVLADASNSSLYPCIGIVKSKPTATTAVVLYSGEISTFSALTIGATYYLSDLLAGAIVDTPPSTAGSIIQSIGVAKNDTTLVVMMDRNFILL